MKQFEPEEVSEATVDPKSIPAGAWTMRLVGHVDVANCPVCGGLLKYDAGLAVCVNGEPVCFGCLKHAPEAMAVATHLVQAMGSLHPSACLQLGEVLMASAQRALAAEDPPERTPF